jgi:hypothetical protein
LLYWIGLLSSTNLAEPSQTLSRLIQAEERISRLEGGFLQSPAGGGTSDGMEARIAKLEAAVDHIQQDVRDIKTEMRDVRHDITGIRTTDFRLIFGAIIAVALGLAGIMAHGFHWL